MFFGRKTRVEPRGLAKPAEHFVVTSTGLHVRVDFLVERADGSYAAVRLLFTRAFAEKACGALETTIEKYQTALGHIRVARDPAPTSPRLSSLEERPVNQLKVSYADEALFLDFGLVLTTAQQSTEFDRLFLVTAIGLAPPLVAALRAALKPG
jgi:hypothetical protein